MDCNHAEFCLTSAPEIDLLYCTSTIPILLPFEVVFSNKKLMHVGISIAKLDCFDDGYSVLFFLIGGFIRCVLRGYMFCSKRHNKVTDVRPFLLQTWCHYWFLWITPQILSQIFMVAHENGKYFRHIDVNFQIEGAEFKCVLHLIRRLCVQIVLN